MIEIVEFCKRSGAPPRLRWVMTADGVMMGEQYCPVCDVPSVLPFALHRAAVWVSDHRLKVRFRSGWLGGTYQRSWSWRDRRRRKRQKPPRPIAATADEFAATGRAR